jgi:superfamily II DNA or RNA helicase
MSADWPHQTRAVADTLAAIEAVRRLIALTSPTGGGKTRIAQRLIERWRAEGLRIAVYTNRKLLVDQLGRALDQAGLPYGVRAAGRERNRGHPLQICSVQTELARKGRWERFPAQRLIVDEAHLQMGPAARELFLAHHADGAAVVGLTATPLGLGGLYDRLIVAGTNSELRACGALVPAVHYGPD